MEPPLDLPLLYIVTSRRREAVIAPQDANYTPGWKLVKLRTSISYKLLEHIIHSAAIHSSLQVTLVLQ